MAYEKTQVQAVGDALLALVAAIRVDGVGIDDLDEAVMLLTALGGASDEFKADADAALLHLAGYILDRVGDTRVNAVV
jgi:hypothetical protein